MGQGNPLPGEQYRHFKNKRYQVITVAYHSETMERYVVYQALYGDFKTYIRPYEMFVSEVDHEKYPEVQQKYRFEYMGNVADAKPQESEKPAEPEKQDVPEATKTVEKPSTVSSTESEQQPDGKDADEIQTESAAAETAKEDESHINPWLDQILDAQNFEEKYKIVCDMQSDITDRLIDDIAVVMDLAIPEGRLSDRYAQLKHCIHTRQRYESGRLR